jgi:hypothetical protein
MHPEKRLLAVLIILGGTAVLGSYVYGFAFWPDALAAMWGGVPDAIRPLYTGWMFVAATGFFVYSSLFLLRTDPDTARVLGGGYRRITLCYALVLVGSALWMPLTKVLLDAPGGGNWWLVKSALYAVAAGSIGIVVACARIEPNPSPGLRRAALLGALAFSFQTVVLDALIWPALFPLPSEL